MHSQSFNMKCINISSDPRNIPFYITFCEEKSRHSKNSTHAEIFLRKCKFLSDVNPTFYFFYFFHYFPFEESLFNISSRIPSNFP